MVPALRAQTRPVPRSAAPDHAPVPGPWFRSTDHAPAPRTIVCPPDHAPAPRTFVRPDHAPAPRTTVRPDHAPAPRTTVPPHEPCSRPARLALGPSPPSGHPLLRTGPPPDQTRLDQPRPSFWPARPGLARPGPAQPSLARTRLDSRSQRCWRPASIPAAMDSPVLHAGSVSDADPVSDPDTVSGLESTRPGPHQMRPATMLGLGGFGATTKPTGSLGLGWDSPAPARPWPHLVELPPTHRLSTNRGGSSALLGGA
jgi:hypothetical protein